MPLLYPTSLSLHTSSPHCCLYCSQCHCPYTVVLHIIVIAVSIVIMLAVVHPHQWPYALILQATVLTVLHVIVLNVCHYMLAVLPITIFVCALACSNSDCFGGTFDVQA